MISQTLDIIIVLGFYGQVKKSNIKVENKTTHSWLCSRTGRRHTRLWSAAAASSAGFGWVPHSLRPPPRTCPRPDPRLCNQTATAALHRASAQKQSLTGGRSFPSTISKVSPERIISSLSVASWEYRNAFLSRGTSAQTDHRAFLPGTLCLYFPWNK